MRHTVAFLLLSGLMMMSCNRKTLYFYYESPSEKEGKFVELQLFKTGEYREYFYQTLGENNDSLNYGNVFVGKYFFIADSLYLTSEYVPNTIKNRTEISANDFHAAYYFKGDNLVQYEPFGYSMYYLKEDLMPGKALLLRETSKTSNINWWLFKDKQATGMPYPPLQESKD